MMTRRRSCGSAARRAQPAFSNRSTMPVMAPLVRLVACASWPAVMGPLRTNSSAHLKSFGPMPTFCAMAEAASTVEVLNSRNAQSICWTSSCRLEEELDFLGILFYDVNILYMRYLTL